MFSKNQIDRLGDRLRRGAIEDADLKLLDAYRRSFVPGYEKVIATIREVIAYHPTGRPAKSTTSIVEKLKRESIRLTQMQDIAGCRLVVGLIGTQNTVVRRLKSKLNAVVVDRRKQPSHGYRAVHVIATADLKPIEIQVRTTLQHLWAEYSEKLADVIDPAIKYGGGPPELRDILERFSDTVAQVEALELQKGTPEQRRQIRNVKQQLRRLLKSATVDVANLFRGK